MSQSFWVCTSGLTSDLPLPQACILLRREYVLVRQLLAEGAMSMRNSLSTLQDSVGATAKAKDEDAACPASPSKTVLEGSDGLPTDGVVVDVNINGYSPLKDSGVLSNRSSVA